MPVPSFDPRPQNVPLLPEIKAAFAAVLTYVRREWENTADPVDVESVRKVRTDTADRATPWTAEEVPEPLEPSSKDGFVA